ncbi:MAG: hypothetical protein ACRD63_11345 [Pyrinomonadaceae bacterium]
MSDIFDEGSAILYMKVGTHAQEPLADIIARKRAEIENAGFAMWGYGGNTCHPTTMVQPFARTHETTSRPILLCMQPMESKHFAEPLRAEQFSSDGISWKFIHESINVLGSRYALCIKTLKQVDASLCLGSTRVALGNSKGKLGSSYVKGRVDKACLEVIEHGSDDAEVRPIKLVAELVQPYAVFLRG